MNDQSDLVRARELLPWYVTGTLADQQREFVDQQLAQSDALRAELAWLRKLQQDMREVTPAVTGDLGWSRFRQRIQAQTQGVVVPLRAVRRPRWYRPALGLAAVILIAQTAVIAVLLNQHTQTLRPLSGPAAGQGPLLQLQLRPSATEQQVRELLNAADAQIVAGPGALGIYTIRVADADATRALQRLRAADKIIESVSPLPR